MNQSLTTESVALKYRIPYIVHFSIFKIKMIINIIFNNKIKNIIF